MTNQEPRAAESVSRQDLAYMERLYSVTTRSLATTDTPKNDPVMLIIREIAATAREQAIEECAAIAKRYVETGPYISAATAQSNITALEIEHAVRALKSPTEDEARDAE